MNYYDFLNRHNFVSRRNRSQGAPTLVRRCSGAVACSIHLITAMNAGKTCSTRRSCRCRAKISEMQRSLHLALVVATFWPTLTTDIKRTRPGSSRKGAQVEAKRRFKGH